MVYKFYVQMDGEIFGPYSAREIVDLQLMDDILVTEESMNNEWLPAGRFDFDDMARNEEAYSSPTPTPPPMHWPVSQPQVTPYSPPQNQRYEVPVDRHYQSRSNADSVPAEIKGWNWGAFFFSWIWGVCNGLYWPMFSILAMFIPYAGLFISLGVQIALGLNGNEWAWKAKHWPSVAEFKRVQRKWAIAALWVFVGSVIFGFLLGIGIAIMG